MLCSFRKLQGFDVSNPISGDRHNYTAFYTGSPLHNAPRGELSERPETCQAQPTTRFSERWSRAGENIVSGGALSFPHIFLFAWKRKMWSRRTARNGVRDAETPAVRP